MAEARADTTTSLEVLQAWEDLLSRSLVEEAATTTTSMATSMDLPAAEDLVRLLVSSWAAEAATTTSNTLATITTTTMDRREALADLQAWPARSWEVVALPTATSRVDSTDRTRTRVMVEAAVLMAAATSSNMDLTKATVAAVAAASSAVSLAETSQTVALAATAIPQEEALAVPTLALRHPAPTSRKVSRTTANLAKDTAALTAALRHRTHTSLRDSPTTANLVQATAPTTMAQRLRALHRSLVLTTRLVETNRTDSNPTVARNKADLEATSSPAPTVDLLSNTVVMTKVATVALEVTISNRAAMANPKADMAADSRLLLEATEAADMSSSMATAATEDDLCRAFVFGYRNVNMLFAMEGF